nr:ABC transporter G family member 11 [Ipomoea batatas]
MTPRTLPAPTLPYRVENWTVDAEAQPSKTWVLQTGIQHVDYSSALPTLGRRILEGKASWNQHPSFKGEFSFTKGYWEWTEVILSRHRNLLEAVTIYDGIYASLFTYDHSTYIVQAFCEAWCPKTNSLLTSAGELSISLWDIHVLCGLPISGDIYDEHVPNALELTGSDADHGFTPQCCKYLFQAYSYLYNRRKRPRGVRNQQDEDRSLHVNEWIEFWSRRPQVYDRPILSKNDKRKSRPKNTQNPSGKIPAFKGWTKVTRAPFVELGIPPELEEETHLAAYLCCWLCQRLNLAIPVLASIYDGLNTISNSANPGQADSRFSLHYVYGWLSFYYDTHFANDLVSASPLMITYSGEGGARPYGQAEARRKIFKADGVKWACTGRRLTKDLSFIDDGKDDHIEDDEYFMCLRSNFLILRWADSCIAEPYTPHRFSRQFGYYQDGSPGILGRDEREVTLAEGFQRWRHFTLRGSGSRVTFPTARVTMKKHFSQSYKDWWTQVHGDYLEHNKRPVPARKENAQSKKIVDAAPVPSGEESESIPPKRKKDIASNQIVDVAPVPSGEESSDEDRNFKRDRKRNRRSPSPMKYKVHSGHRVPMESFNLAFASLHKLDLDISPLETRVEEVFKKARKFDELRSTISEKISSESQGVSLSTAKDELKKAQDKVARLKEDILNQHKSFKAVQDREAELEQELKLARAARENWDTLIAKTTKDLGNAKTAASEAEAEVTRIQDLAVLTSEDAKKLKKAKGDLEVNKNNMRNFRLFVD